MHERPTPGRTTDRPNRAPGPALVYVTCTVAAVLFCMAISATAQDAAPEPIESPSVPSFGDFNFSIGFGGEDGEGNLASNIQLLFIITVLSLAPGILVMMTSFTRIVIVFSFLRQALGTQQMPPNQIIVGLSLFLTMFVMTPVWRDANENALQPYLANELTQPEAFRTALVPIRGFMFRQVREADLALMVRLSELPNPTDVDDVPTLTLIPAFIISELKTAFQIAFLIYLPFVVIDLVVASSLMSVGVIMLPPLMISLPLKLLLFVLSDGWNLLVRGLVTGFQ